MEEIRGFQSYQEYKKELDTELNRAAESFVRIGYLLKTARDTDILSASGYENVTQFAEAEYNLRPDQVSRFIQINDRFAAGGYSDRLEERYAGIGYTKLVEMLQLPDAITEEITAGITREELRDIRSEVEQENKVTPMERWMEEKDSWQQDMTAIGKVLHQLLKEEQKLFRDVFAWNAGTGDLKEILAPSGEKIYSVRIAGTGRYMLFLKEQEERAALVNVRTNEKEFHAWEEIGETVRRILPESGTPEEAYRALYGEELSQEEAQQEKKPEKPKESKVRKAEKPKKETEAGPIPMPAPETTPAEEKQEERETAAEDPKAAETGQVQTEAPPLEAGTETPGTETSETEIPGAEIPAAGQLEGNGEIVPAQIPRLHQECPERDKPYGTRKDYLDGCTEYGIASYLKKELDPEFLRMAAVEDLEAWFLKDVDHNGREIEEY